MSSSAWGLGRRVAFRFGISFGILLVYPFPFGLLPHQLDWFTADLRKPWDWSVSWFAQSMLGLRDPVWNAGSSDATWNYVQLLLIVIAATLGTIAWSVLDRRRTSYSRLAAIAHVVLRYVLAGTMLWYGISKIMRSQFPELLPVFVGDRFGDISPMGLLWRFMEYSTPYTVFAGVCEALGAVLLLWRRTATLGAVVLIPVMINVVMLNFCYDVDVKLLSTELLAMAIVVAAPSIRRVVAAVLGYATAEAPPRERMSPRWERASRAAKFVMISYLATTLCVEFSTLTDWNDHGHELYGSWAVDSFMADGVEVPPVIAQPDRWRECALSASLLTTWALDGTSKWFRLDVDATTRTLNVKRRNVEETWKYTRPSPDHLVIAGVHDGKYLNVTLHLKRNPLFERGFHWINEAAFNR